MATTTVTATGTITNQVRIQLSTRDVDLELPEQPGPILVSTNLRRYELSTLVNSLLTTTSRIPLDFLINGQILRTSLDTYLTQHALSAESLLAIEYIRAQLPPQTRASFEHDDWVGSIDVLSADSPAALWSAADIRKGTERIISGSFDGILRIWDMSGQILAASTSSQGEEARKRVQHIMATRFISPSLIAAASGSRPQLWRYTESSSETPAPGSASLELALDCYGHTSGINALAVHGPSQHFLTASDDHTACVWSSNLSDSSALPPVPAHLTPAPSTKRRKLASSSTPSCGPLAVLSGHTAPLTGTIFHPADSTAAYTISRDGALRTWDLETARCVTVRTPAAGHTRLTALCALPGLGDAGGLLAIGTCYNSVLLVDPREAAGGEGSARSAVMTLRGHRNEVSAVCASAESNYGLASAAYDGTVRVWDVRNTAGAGDLGIESGAGVGKASFKIPRRGNERCDEVAGGLGVKVFDLCWDKEVGIVSAGEDKSVQIDK